MGKFIIKDWNDNRLFPNEVFDSFDDGWDFVNENVDNSLFDESEDENDDEYQDIFVVELK